MSHKPELIDAAVWKKQRPLMIMIKSEDWAKIEKVWLATCRQAGGDCDVTVSSVADTIYKLDDLAGSILQGFHP